MNNNINKYLNNFNNKINIELEPSNLIDYIAKTNESHKIITPLMKKINKDFKNMRLLYNSLNNDYYRYIKKTNNITKYGYCTIIFCDSKYLSSILATGFYLKHILKTKYNIICLVQDKPFYEKDNVGNNYLKFQGISLDEIEAIKKIYDVVIGIDLIKVVEQRTQWNMLSQYKKLPYYCTKLLCLGLVDYKKLIYYDSSSLITKNIDYIFDNYNKSTYRVDNTELKRGLIGNFYLFIPNTYYIYKGIYLAQNYNSIFKNLFSNFTKDEDIVFYTVFPNWNNEFLDASIFRGNYKRYPYFNAPSNDSYSVELYMGKKPFLYPLNDDVIERDMYHNNNNCYYLWDLSVKKMLEKFPELYIFFEFIKTFRYVNF